MLALPKHPFPVKTIFRSCFLVNFAIDPEVMQSLLPRPIEVDLFDGEAYLSIVIARMDRMRPAFAPRILGISYNQVVYRVVVRCQGERGVHFLRSDADNPLMCVAGNAMSFFRFHYSHMRFHKEGAGLSFDLQAAPNDHADIHATFTPGCEAHTMPSSSRFSSLADAQQYLVELFAAFTSDLKTERISTVRINRGIWNISVVEDSRAQYDYMQNRSPFTHETTRLDSIFYVEDLPYYWHRLNH